MEKEEHSRLELIKLFSKIDKEYKEDIEFKNLTKIKSTNKKIKRLENRMMQMEEVSKLVEKRIIPKDNDIINRNKSIGKSEKAEVANRANKGNIVESQVLHTEENKNTLKDRDKDAVEDKDDYDEIEKLFRLSKNYFGKDNGKVENANIKKHFASNKNLVYKNPTFRNAATAIVKNRPNKMINQHHDNYVYTVS